MGGSGTLIRTDTNFSTKVRAKWSRIRWLPPPPDPFRVLFKRFFSDVHEFVGHSFARPCFYFAQCLDLSLGALKNQSPHQNNALTLTKQKIAYVWISCTINLKQSTLQDSDADPHPEAFAANSNPASDADPAHRYKHCCGSTLVSMRIRIQLLISMRIPNLGPTLT